MKKHALCRSCLLTALLCLSRIVGALGDACAWDPQQPATRNSRAIIDISVTVHPDLPAWDEVKGLGPHRTHVQRQDEGGLATVSKVELVVHTGTHFDAPSHFLPEAFKNGVGIEQADLATMNGPAIVLDVPRDSNITGNKPGLAWVYVKSYASMPSQAEALLSPAAEVLQKLPIPPGTERLLFRTSSSERHLMYKTPFETAYTALTGDGAQWVADAGIKFVGIDYLSIARYEELATAHQNLMQAGVHIVEGLDLINVQPGLYDVHCLPLKLHGSDGAPGRCILVN